MATVRKSGLDISVFTLGNSYIDDLHDADLQLDIKEVDAKSVHDTWDYPWAVSRGWKLECEIFVNAQAGIMQIAAGTAQVNIAFGSGAQNYSGQGLITAAHHKVPKEGLQMQKVTIKGQGPLVVA